MERRRKWMAAAVAATLGLTASAASLAEDADEQGARRALVTDFSGKPPFKRRYEQVPAAEAEFARFEETRSADSPDVGEKIRVVDARGRPPFKRSVVEIDESNVVEFARFEEVAEPSQPARRPGPPGKGFGRFR